MLHIAVIVGIAIVLAVMTGFGSATLAMKIIFRIFIAFVALAITLWESIVKKN